LAGDMITLVPAATAAANVGSVVLVFQYWAIAV
jgi:hypothetical protein